MNLVKFPGSKLDDIPGALRRLAEEIESGAFGEVHRLVWIVEVAGGVNGLGLIGPCAEPGPMTYMMLGLAKRRIEMGEG
mgnify:CR=1 FL=1